MNTEIPETNRASQIADASPSIGSRSVILIARALLKAIRPKQATKNLFVFAALIFAGDLFDRVKLARTLLAFALFTAVSGSIYLFNDILDVQQDRLHPEKCKRPLASGQLPLGLARFASLGLAAGGLGAGFALSARFGLALLSYFALQMAYNLWLKRIVLLDVFAIAIGFVLRTVAGALVIHVSISNWLLLCSLQLALFMGFGKRRQELVLLGSNAGKHRAILEEYSLPFLDQLINIVVGMTIVCYSVYCVESASARLHPHLWITVPIVLYSVSRYMYLVYRKGWGGAPEDVLMKDRSLQVAMVLWLIAVLILFAFDSPAIGFVGLN